MKQSIRVKASIPAPCVRFALRTLAASLVAAFGSVLVPAWAQQAPLPTGLQAPPGQATVSVSADGNLMTVTNAPNAVLSWASFSIGDGKGVRFDQVDASSKVLNRVLGNDPSNILGTLSSNGQVWLINPNGVLFGTDSKVNVAGLVASTLDIADADFLADSFKFRSTGVPGGAVDAKGDIATTFGGRVWLIGHSVRNDGTVNALGGHIVQAAGNSVELVDSGLPHLSVRVEAPQNEVANLGSLLAHGGRIDVYGSIVNQKGIIRAESLSTTRIGSIRLEGTSDVTLDTGSVTSVDDKLSSSPSGGGRLEVVSLDGTTTVRGLASSASTRAFGGLIDVLGKNVTVESGAEVSVSGATFGGAATLEAADGTALVQGAVTSVGGNDHGGTIDVFGGKVGVYGQGRLDASGAGIGGNVNLGRNPEPDALPSAIYVGPAALIAASATGSNGTGGDVIIGAGGDATRVYGTLAARGGPGEGTGGDVIVSGRFADVQARAIDVEAPGGVSGAFRLAAGNITIVPDSPAPVTDLPNFDATTADADGKLAAGLVANALAAGAEVVLRSGDGQATTPGNIVVAADIVANSASPFASLDLVADNDIVIDPGRRIEALGTPIPVSLRADEDVLNGGAIRMGRQSRILTAGGDIVLAGGTFADAPYGPARSISLEGSVLDAGTGTITAASDQLALTDARLRSAAPGDAIYLRTKTFSNSGGTLDTSAGRWIVYLESGAGAFPAAAFENLDYSFVQVDAARSDADAPAGNGVLMADPLHLRIKVDALRQYDGTTVARFSRPLSSDAPAGFAVVENGGNANGLEGSFDDANTGTDKPIGYEDEGSGIFRIVTGKGVTVTGATQSYVGDITPRLLALSGLSAADKVYDATRSALVSGSLANVIEGDQVVLSGLDGLFDTKNAGIGKTVTVSATALSGADAFNYALPPAATTTASIARRPVTASAFVGADKVYDGTRRAFLSFASFPEMLPGDSLALGTSEILFEDKNVGTGKLVTFTSSVLAGADAANYVLTGPLTTTASITPRPLEIGISGTVRKQYDAGTAASLEAGQFVLHGAIAGDVLSVGGPRQGVYESPGVGEGKPVTVAGTFEIAGADAPNYRVGSVPLTTTGTNQLVASASGNVGSITPAPLLYVAAPAVREAGLPPADLSGTVTGFLGSDTLANATSGTLLWQTPATAASPPGSYAIIGSGLAASNYLFGQAPGNAAALAIAAPAPPPAPPAPAVLAQENNNAALGTALHAAVAAIDPGGIGGGVSDMSAPEAGRSFGAVRISSMNQNELAQMLDARRAFKRKLFADAIHRLEIDPGLADLRPCSSVAEASMGACRLTLAQLELSHAARTQPTAHGRKAGARAASLPQIERKIALLIGINDYQDQTIPRLENAVPDADAVGRLFADKLGYDVRVLRNPTKAEIVRSLNQLATEIGTSDSVVVYYAGHGYSLEKNGAGYWLPSDALANDPRQWLSNGDIAKMLGGVRAKQMALISDSCYSGAFAREGLDAVGHNVTADDVLAKRSVVVLSSGGDEPVADEGKGMHSIFAWNLMKVVDSVDGWRPGSTIFTEVQVEVRKEFPQTPKYGSVTAAGHQRGGDYLFELR